MKELRRFNSRTGMGPDAYAGFLRLWLTPAGKAPRPTRDVDAYLTYANAREPLSSTARRALASKPVDEAA